MPYQFNPHRHVKIWLSKNSHTFLNLENQIRLVKMRHINPEDVIYFVYDKSLLSKKAYLELQSFCKKYKLISINVRQDIFPHCDNIDERHLIEIYEDEIAHIDEGGNLGVASDVLRWLKPIYELGTYADFDVHINTSRLPETILVEKPLLFNLGSISFTADVESITVNNDIIAVIDMANALSDIQKIQQHIYRSCSRQSPTEVNFLQDYQTRFITSLSQFISPVQAQQVFDQDIDLQTLSIIDKLIKGNTAREVRLILIDITEDNLVYSKTTLMSYDQSLDDLKDHEIISRAITLLRKKPNNPYKDIQDDNQFLTLNRQSLRMAFLKNIVVYTSGPNALLSTIFSKMFLRKALINQEIRPFSFSYYGLESAFVSQNSFAFHENLSTVKAKYFDTEIGKYNDLSWLDAGENATKKREEEIKEHQMQIPQILHEIREAIEAYIEETQEDSACCFGFYRYKTKIAQINALQSLMQYFEDDSFDANGFNQTFQDKDSSNIEKNRTKLFIDELKFFAKASRDYMLIDEHGKVKIPSEKSLVHLRDGCV